MDPDPDRNGDVYASLANKFGGWAVDTAKECNTLTHTGADASVDLRDLINRSERLAQKIAAS